MYSLDHIIIRVILDAVYEDLAGTTSHALHVLYESKRSGEHKS